MEPREHQLLRSRLLGSRRHPLKIGVMLRHFGQHGGGVWVYTRNLLREIAPLDVQHKFVLIYSDPRFVGTYGDGKRIREVAVKAPHRYPTRYPAKNHKIWMICRLAVFGNPVPPFP
jgi:hypothetical protein